MADDINWLETDAFHPPEIPESLGIDPLLSALVCTLLYIELSGEKTLDLDEAVAAEEAIGYYLRRLTPDRVAAIEEQLSKLGDYAEQHAWGDDAVECIRGFLTDAGVRADPDDLADD